MSERASAMLPPLGAICACLALSACASGRSGVTQMSAANLPELGEETAARPAARGANAAMPMRLSVNSPVAELCANPAAKKVLDDDLPGLTSRPEYAFFKHMSLRSLKNMSGGKLTEADLARVEAELEKLNVGPSGYEADR